MCEREKVGERVEEVSERMNEGIQRDGKCY